MTGTYPFCNLIKKKGWFALLERVSNGATRREGWPEGGRMGEGCWAMKSPNCSEVWGCLDWGQENTVQRLRFLGKCRARRHVARRWSHPGSWALEAELTLIPPVLLRSPPHLRVDTGSTAPAVLPSGTAISSTVSSDSVFHFDFSILPSTAPQLHHVFRRRPQTYRRSEAFHSTNTR